MQKLIEMIAKSIYEVEEERNRHLAGVKVWERPFEETPFHIQLSYREKAIIFFKTIEKLKEEKDKVLERKLKRFYGYPPYNTPGNVRRGDVSLLNQIKGTYTETAIKNTLDKMDKERKI